jgi:hypothetical protein
MIKKIRQSGGHWHSSIKLCGKICDASCFLVATHTATFFGALNIGNQRVIERYIYPICTLLGCLLTGNALIDLGLQWINVSTRYISLKRTKTVIHLKTFVKVAGFIFLVSYLLTFFVARSFIWTQFVWLIFCSAIGSTTFLGSVLLSSKLKNTEHLSQESATVFLDIGKKIIFWARHLVLTCVAMDVSIFLSLISATNYHATGIMSGLSLLACFLNMVFVQLWILGYLGDWKLRNFWRKNWVALSQRQSRVDIENSA